MSTHLNFSHTDKLFDRASANTLTVIGVGAIGGHVVLAAAKMGVSNIRVWDFDLVESHNIPYSVYRPDDVGKLKVSALKDIVRAHANIEIDAIPEPYSGDQALKNTTVLSCVDTLTSREEVWRQVSGNATVDLLIDTRSARWYIEVYMVNPNDPVDRESYGNTLFSDHAALKQMCGMHGLSFLSMRAAGAALSLLSGFWSTGKRRWRYIERCDTLETF